MPYINQIQTSASESRLEKLIAERLKPGADKAKIDARIWDLFGETWAVMFTDLSGFSRSVAEFGIIHFLQIIYESQRLLVPCIDRYDGILLKTEGDSMLVIFRQARKAAACAIAMQRAAKRYNQDKPDTEKILLCVGLGYGKILKIGDRDVFGPEVNAASKLGEDTAKAWEILGTGTVAEHLKTLNKISLEPISTIPPGAKQAFRIIYPL
ncbi:adenylate/guanylate cyclase domain-containing protein [Lusitaniella coriacea LEGE 07157]|uniref:Adenylate/guanylate cyclase domain-containing protein n=1 Tax=Lusitaniella coriacea LEGE 07157 TaxID=945747 RepID=A0A8J7DXX4_9CYAN|nr:adenylate/guanylate cyclase domain-containing protein [Lusitaniella coriacea]MBE9117517.1 adenylate/guanylate cyclase domain-containing protein [Lusitaniella coriacea LEGE 07157]